MSRQTIAFGALIVMQAAHSVEEFTGRLWETFPPATFLTGLVSPDREFGFLVLNASLAAFGLWCLLWPVRRNWNSGRPLMWFWIGVETINGIGHPAWSLREGGYTPGLLTAPILLSLALYLAFQLHQVPGPAPRMESRRH